MLIIIITTNVRKGGKYLLSFDKINARKKNHKKCSKSPLIEEYYSTKFRHKIHGRRSFLHIYTSKMSKMSKIERVSRDLAELDGMRTVHYQRKFSNSTRFVCRWNDEVVSNRRRGKERGCYSRFLVGVDSRRSDGFIQSIFQFEQRDIHRRNRIHFYWFQSHPFDCEKERK